MSGTVYLVGAGPGAADLLTLRAARLLERADIVFHDALVPQEILALCSKALLVKVGKRSGRYATAQAFINKQLADAAKKYKVVVRLKGGDPMLFGRAHEEIGFLKERRIACSVVPGVTAALAASAELQLSLTRRGLSRSVLFLTPRSGTGERPNEWATAALAADTVAIYMGAGEAAASNAVRSAPTPTQVPVVSLKFSARRPSNTRPLAGSAGAWRPGGKRALIVPPRWHRLRAGCAPPAPGRPRRTADR